MLAFGGFPGSVDIQNFVTDKLWDQDFNNSIGGRTVDNASLIDAWAAEAGGLDVTLDPDSRIGLDEDIIAFYAMVTTEFDWESFANWVPIRSAFWHYEGGLTTPGCSEAVNWYINKKIFKITSENSNLLI